MIDVNTIDISEIEVHDFLCFLSRDYSNRNKISIRNMVYVTYVNIHTKMIDIKPMYKFSERTPMSTSQIHLYDFVKNYKLLKIIKKSNSSIEELIEDYPEVFI